ncbi:TonB-dependent siderophore receptor [Anabaena sp. FACHB-709]|uniref:Ferrichrome-iron receptor n=2 Tax=Nostocaceae TaxID=1162 RepID=A0A1Z4KFL2_ANAVA|nr:MULTISPECIES: TonB-dependent siderophore receptor [Nostocaceae]BAY67770.1 ferrichrome-iron receptor [Trichormus variabilis NIES-23]MBD2170137.1 TonB-dependent siderophore receptor [Anabaena cylindrica FACHB-318]MBD2261443.1 TonB-dependent siderophore receptor [Anabaena sp. FACHB-709]MBD2271027.1 TonB-dependent siderophore receptor [Nostoc sp. PCC 7120 = FACHB-418]MBD2282702.1 TonB-dependent siderophore receptor [Anabaena cylindrica FACHB-170]
MRLIKSLSGLMFTASVFILTTQSVLAETDGGNSVDIGDKSKSVSSIPQLSEVKPPQTNAALLLTQNPDAEEIVEVTGVRINQTEKGVEVILETAKGDALKPVQKNEGNKLIIDIPNSQLRYEGGDTFRQEKPFAGIAEVLVVNQDNNTIQVTVTGETGLPIVELFDGDEGLIFGVTPATTTAQQPQTPQAQEKPAIEIPQEEPAAQQDEPIELVVTGQQNGYRVQDATTATKTDTPLRDIPQSIQVVPREVLEDRNVRSLAEAVETVSGVVDGADYNGSPAQDFIIRGFEQGGSFRNGYRDVNSYGLTGVGTIERVEVLKGPASVLFGAVEPGGIINVVTKQPLSEPYYQLGFEVGNRAFYQPSIDFSGPLNADKTLLYRFNASYQSSDGFQDFVNTNLTTIAPTIAWKLGDRTDLTLYYEYINFKGTFEQYTSILSDNTFLPRSFYQAYPNNAYVDNTTQKLGYTLSHKFSDNWQIRNNFSVVTSKNAEEYTLATGVVNDQSLRQFAQDREFTQDNYFGQIDLLGKFNTGSISHQILIGFDFNHNIDTFARVVQRNVPNLDIFNPNYNIPSFDYGPRSSSTERFQTYGIYLQDQITFLDNLKLLIGGRFDWISGENTDNVTGDTTQNPDSSAFSPRIGLVYQPSKSVSLYTSYSQSFVPETGVNPDGEIFEPTRGTQYEAGIKADFLEGRLSATLAAYQITKSNILTPDPDPERAALDYLIQVGEQRSRGIELDVAGEILPGWKAIASYAYTNAEVTEDNDIPVGNRLVSVPKNQASLWTTYEFQNSDLKGLGFGLGLFYVGTRSGDSANSFEIPDYLRTDAAIYYRRDGFKAGINIRNLFDTDYIRTSDDGRTFLRRGAPFTIIGSISWEF